MTIVRCQTSDVSLLMFLLCRSGKHRAAVQIAAFGAFIFAGDEDQPVRRRQGSQGFKIIRGDQLVGINPEGQQFSVFIADEDPVLRFQFGKAGEGTIFRLVQRVVPCDQAEALARQGAALQNTCPVPQPFRRPGIACLRQQGQVRLDSETRDMEAQRQIRINGRSRTVVTRRNRRVCDFLMLFMLFTLLT